MGRSLRELLATVDSAELSLWEAEYAIEPWGEMRADLRAGIIASTMANMWKGKGKALEPRDFMPFLPKDEPSPDELRRKLRAWFEGMSRGQHR